MRPYIEKHGKLKRLQHGGTKSILRLKWVKFTVMSSMKRFLRAGGGSLLLHAEGEDSTIVVLITKRTASLQTHLS